MSDKLAISTAFSVLMMASYVLFGADAIRMPVGPGSVGTPVSVSAPALPSIGGPSINRALDLLGLPPVQ